MAECTNAGTVPIARAAEAGYNGSLMKPFAVDLIEEDWQVVWRFGSSGRVEHAVHRRDGVLRRAFHGGFSSQSIEVASIAEGLKATGRKYRLDDSWGGVTPLADDPGPVQKIVAPLREALAALSQSRWQITVRSRSNRRLVFNRREHPQIVRWLHHTLNLKLTSPGDGRTLEFAAGSFDQPSFHLEGLLARVRNGLDAEARRRPFGSLEGVPVVLGPGDGAIFFHEVLGHSLEADYIQQGLSPFSVADLGQPVLGGEITLRTRLAGDPFFAHIPCDDEGEVAGEPVLVAGGRLQGILADTFTARTFSLPGAGHARTAGFSSPPWPRQFALYVDAGSADPRDIVAQTRLGVYAREFGDGQVMFGRGQFQFVLRDAWLIEDGEITVPLGGVTVAGPIRETLRQIGAVGNDFRLDRGASFCTKNGQTLPVRVGQPTVRIDRLTVWEGIDV